MCHKKIIYQLSIIFIIFVWGNIMLSLAQDPGVDGVDEIVVVGTDGFIYVYDHQGSMEYKSAEGGWTMVATADLNNDQDEEIIAANSRTIKVYDPQIIGTEYAFNVTYSRTDGSFIKITTGNFISNDATHEIGLIFKRNDNNDTKSHIVVFDPTNTTPVADAGFFTDLRDFTPGDYDGDGDDDFAVISWNSGNPSGHKNFFELWKGHNPSQRLEDSTNNSKTGDSEWFDVAAGNFSDANGNRDEWIGTQNLDKVIITQRWDDEKNIKNIWSISANGAFEYLATDDFRQDIDGIDQTAMLRNLDHNDSRASLQFVKNGIVWSSINRLGRGWLNLATGNLDNDPGGYREAVTIKGNQIYIYLLPQAGTNGENTFLNCNTAGNCLIITTEVNLQGGLAVGDLGTYFGPVQTVTPFSITPLKITRFIPHEAADIVDAQITITGEDDFNVPLAWEATIGLIEPYWQGCGSNHASARFVLDAAKAVMLDLAETSTKANSVNITPIAVEALLTDTMTITVEVPVTVTEIVTVTEPVTVTEIVTITEIVTVTEPVTVTEIVTVTESVTTTEVITIYSNKYPWLSLNNYSGTTNPTSTIVTAVMNNTGQGSHCALVMFRRKNFANYPDSEQARIMVIDIFIYDNIYLPLALK